MSDQYRRRVEKWRNRRDLSPSCCSTEWEVLDFAGPFEVFSATAELAGGAYFRVARGRGGAADSRRDRPARVLGHLRELASTTDVRPDERVVDAGRIVTTGGISSGIDGSFHVVQRLLGADVAGATARYMEYDLGSRGAEGHDLTGDHLWSSMGPSQVTLHAGLHFKGKPSRYSLDRPRPWSDFRSTWVRDGPAFAIGGPRLLLGGESGAGMYGLNQKYEGTSG